MTISFKVSEKIKQKMIKFYKPRYRDTTPQYAVFQAKDGDVVITLYESGKVVFQGMSADVDASIWQTLEERVSGKVTTNVDKNKDENKKEDLGKNYYYNIDAIGSDEVGTGDFFGPIVVTSSYVKKEDIPFLEKLGIKDSKKVTDSTILKIAPALINKIDHKTITLTNKEYNDMWSEKVNMNAIKAKLHNKVLYELKNEIDCNKIIVDQFTSPKSYFFYLKDEEVIQKDITFIIHAEDKNLAVATSSIISRYYFIKYMDEMSKKYNLDFVKGAGPLVDKAGAEFIKNNGFEKLEYVAKLNFKNVGKIKELI